MKTIKLQNKAEPVVKDEKKLKNIAEVKEKLESYRKKQEEKNQEEHKLAEKKSQADLYKILGVPRNADPAEIKERYLQLALLYHPDKETGDLQKFKDVCLAYKVLSSKKRRKEYDQALASTFDELREVERDLEYHTTDKFTKLDGEGERVFDEEAFKAEFEKSRAGVEQQEMNEMQSKLDKKQLKNEAVTKEDFEDLLAARERDFANFQETVGQPLINPDPNQFDASIFNQMFNDLKAKRQALEPVNDDLNQSQEGMFFGMMNEPVAFQGMGASAWQGSGNYGGYGGADWGASFGSTAFSGAGDAVGFDRQTMFAQNDAEMLQEIRAQADQYKSDPNMMHVRDQMEKEHDAEYRKREMEARMAEMALEREKLKHMDKSEYIVRPDMISKALGDSELFQDQPLTIDAVKESTWAENDEEDDENDEEEAKKEEYDIYDLIKEHV